MRQAELRNSEAFDVVEGPATAKPRNEQRVQPAAAAPDMPKAAGIFMVGSYAAIMAAFVVTIHGARADFAIVIGCFYLAMFFAIPAIFFGVENDRVRRPSMLEFLDKGVETATGRISGSGALVQMLIVPVLLAFAILAMGITYLLV
jgi:hypothetical protein